MSYKPKFCCECGEKVERPVWRFWTNRRFCQLCETNFGIYDTVQNFVLVFLALVSIIGVGNLFRKPEKELVRASNQFAVDYQNANKQKIFQTDSAVNSDKNILQNVSPTAVNNFSEPTKKLPTESNGTKSLKNSDSPQIATTEVVYFCGAQTKKGAPCSRRIKNGGRCWQHTGQAAMLPQQKLIASQ